MKGLKLTNPPPTPRPPPTFSEGTSSVAFEALIINWEENFINLPIFYCLMSNIHLFNFNCLTSNFCFPKNTSSANRRKQLFMEAHPYFRILNSFGEMMTCYLPVNNTKGIELKRLVLFEILEMPQLRGTSV